MTLDPKDHSAGEQQPPITLARWGTRFWAWLVDFVIVIIATEVLFSIAYAPLAFNQGMQQNPGFDGAKYAIQSLIFFVYWIYFESTTGQSIGKKLLKIKTTDMAGKTADIRSVAIQSFGKAFLLPIDVFLGWIFTNDKRQRLLSRAGNTIVIKTMDEGIANNRSGAQYKKD